MALRSFLFGATFCGEQRVQDNLDDIKHAVCGLWSVVYFHHEPRIPTAVQQDAVPWKLNGITLNEIGMPHTCLNAPPPTRGSTQQKYWIHRTGEASRI